MAQQSRKPADGRARRAVSILSASAAIYALLAYGSIELTRTNGAIAVVWLPNALAIAALLRIQDVPRGPMLGVLFLASTCANMAQGFAPFVAVGLAAANIAEIAVATVLTRRWSVARPDMRNLQHLLRFAVAAGVLAPGLSVLIAAPVLAAAGADFWASAVGWSITDSTANLLVAPAALILWDAWHERRRPGTASAVEWTGLTLLGLAVTAAVFYQSQFPFLFFVPLVVVLQAFRLGSLGTAVLVSGISVVATVYTTLGQGPINLVNYDFATELLVLQTFLVSCFMVGLPVAALLNKRAAMLREIEAQRSELRMLADNITDAVLQYDMHGLCVYASPSTETVLGRPPEDFIGWTASERLHPEARDAIEKLEANLVAGALDKARITYRRLLDDEHGRPVHIEADCAVARDHLTGAHEGVLVSARDVSERLRLEEQLVSARRHAEQAALAKSQFLANMSHELRTPMNGVLGFADLLRSSDLPPEAAHHARIIAHSGRSMMQILNDILDLSKIEAGEMSLNREAVVLEELINDCIELQVGVADAKGIALHTSIDARLPDTVVADPLRLQQMLLNLIGNAVKFTEEGRVDVRARRDGDSIRIEVSDTGIGIEEARLDAVLDPFVQAESDTSRRFGGSGLGLSITRHLARMMDGSLGAESTFGEGSTFTLTLPCVAADRRREDRPTTTLAPPVFAPTARILVAEDHDVNRMLITAMLERCGLTCDFVHDGNAAIERVVAAAAGRNGYDLVLMDIQMPECDGYEATRAIRLAGIGGPELPIIALTANAYQSDIDAARSAGMQGHLAKPITFEQLTCCLGRWLPHRITEDERMPITARGPAAAATKGPGGSHRSIEERWHQRRAEGLEALRDALAGGLDEASRPDLARQMHKLAGTAGMFGEEALGKAAGELERALLDDELADLSAPAAALLALARREGFEDDDDQRKTAAR